MALLHQLHRKEGKLPWATLIQPALHRAQIGFPMSPRLHQLLSQNKSTLRHIAAVKALYFTRSGQVKPIHTRVINRAYAQTLQEIAVHPQSMYTGKIAHDLIGYLNRVAGQRIVQASDFAHYQVFESPAICHPFRQWSVCSTPFGSGGVSLLELLAIYAEQTPAFKLNSADWVYRFLEASQLTFADRNQYIADPALMSIQAQALLAKDYLQARSQLITDKALKPPVQAGKPRGSLPQQAADPHSRRHGTTSLVIVDADGNGISMTLSIEHEFGSQWFVDGFFLNNELTDFSFMPTDVNGQRITNQITPNARPRSAISPTMVFDAQQQLTVLTGSPGGAVIICYVARNLIALLDFNLSPEQSAASGNLCAMNATSLIEKNSNLTRFLPALHARGEVIQPTELVSGIVTIQRATSKPGWLGAADPRREGEAMGD